MMRLFGVLLIAGSLLTGWLWIDYKAAMDEPVSFRQPVLFEIGKGQAFRNIAADLEARGVVRSARWMSLHARFTGQASRVKVGEFEILPGMNAREILELFISGNIKHYSIMFPEGCRFSEMLDALQEHPKIGHTAGLDESHWLTKLGINEASGEGLFFPDTYHFVNNDTDLMILTRARQRMQEVLQEEWEGRAPGLPLATPYQALILASIVEKETGLASERQQIAGVFVRRLDKGMRLQTDPTVIYGMGDNYQGNITRADLRKDTPYNTYTRKGLPPTPIAMPGKDAIHAALHPDAGSTLYFVARGDGSHVFSSTLQEHNLAVDLYQRKKRSAK